MIDHCPNCNSQLLVPGRIEGVEPAQFIPANPKFLASASKVHIKTFACAMCGFITFAVDTEELGSKVDLQPAEPSQTDTLDSNNDANDDVELAD